MIDMEWCDIVHTALCISGNTLASHSSDPGLIPSIGMWGGHLVRTAGLTPVSPAEKTCWVIIVQYVLVNHGC